MKIASLSLLAAFLAPALAVADPPSTHGMLVFGKGQVFVSHLPMFHSPHDYQLLAEVALPPDALAVYQRSLAEHPEENIYTLVPERLVLPDLVNHPFAFHADLYRGHFERGGTVIAGGLTVSLGRILFFRKFVPGEAKPASATDLLFGSPAEPYLAHYIVARPDFDQIVALGPNPGAVSGTAITVEEPDSRFDEPLKTRTLLTLHPRGGGPVIPASVARALYLETGDLSD